jgi:hypothetical protein
MRPNVKPLTHWIIYRGYRVRFRERDAGQVGGVLITPQGEVEFRYDPLALIVHLPDERIAINQHGWEITGATDDTTTDDVHGL